MGGEVWAIIGVVVGAIVGAIATGAMNLWHARLQREWSTKDADRAADRAWIQEKRSRLFEAKRSAHEAFSEALHRGHGIVLETFDSGSMSIGNHTDYGPAMVELMRVRAQLHIYGSPDASDAAGEAADALGAYGEAMGWGSEFEDRRTAYHRARARYLYIARLDVEVEESAFTLDDLKSLPSQRDVDPQQSP